MEDGVGTASGLISGYKKYYNFINYNRVLEMKCVSKSRDALDGLNIFSYFAK